MKSDFDLIVHKFDDKIKIYPIYDLHVGSAEFMENKWKAFIKQVQSEDNSYVILGGDLMNNSTRTSVSNIFEETMRPREQKEWLVEQLTPIKDKILCIISGNHERRSEKDADDNPMYDVACKLGLEDLYRSNVAFMKIQIGTRDEVRGRSTYTFACTHGSGGGILTGGTVNRNERFAHCIEGIDALIVGHTHKGTVSMPQKIVVDTKVNTVSTKDIVVISATSWQKYGGYATQKMLLPASNKLQCVNLSKGNKEISVRW